MTDMKDRKQIRRLGSLLLGLGLLLQSLQPLTVYAAGGDVNYMARRYGAALQAPDVIEVPFDAEEYTLHTNQKTAIATSWGTYGKYASTYFYEQMSTKEKVLYDALYAVCASYLDGTSDFTYERKYDV